MAGSAHLYSLVLLTCIILDGAELFGGGHFWTYPSCYALLFYFLCLFLPYVWFGGFPHFHGGCFFSLNSWGLGGNGWVGAARMYPGTENVWQSYCMSLGCDELMGWYDMGWMVGRLG
jgi:hypothetical protein